ncbi:MAG: hypothetical protein JHC33_14645 [Ignisphaera sp.]|nr:hypothetical protein [Ignisphaera sp.]
MKDIKNEATCDRCSTKVHEKAYNSAIEGLFNQSNSVDEILEERGNRYGEYSEQRFAVAQILEAMTHVYLLKHKEPPSMIDMVDWFYMAIKIARIPADTCYKDNYDDLIGYATLIRDSKR